MKPTWQADDGAIQLYLGDSLEILPTLRCRSVDAFITDPPYIIGATSVGTANAKAGTWADMENAAWWFAAWFKDCKRALRSTGYLVSCGNWRSIPTLICAMSKAQMTATSCLVWDKQWIGPAYKNALRPTYEIAILAAMPDAEIPDRSASDIFRGEKWLAGQCKTTSHPAEKPVDLFRHMIELTTRPGSVVADPFMGSGTSCIACMDSGRRFIGMEKDVANFHEAVDRIRSHKAKSTFLDPATTPRPVQKSLLSEE